MQAEFAIHCADLSRLDQARMRDQYRVQRPFELFAPKCEKAMQLGEIGVKVVVLPNVGLQQPEVIGSPVENACGRQPVAFELTPEILATHLVLHSGWTIDLTFLVLPLQAQKVNKLFIINALAALVTVC